MILLRRLLRSCKTWKKTSDLLDIADHYGLPNVKKTMLKHEIKNSLIQFFDSSSTSQILVTRTDFQLGELEIKSQVEMEKLRFEHENRIRVENEEREEKSKREKEQLEERIRLETLEREEKREKIEQEKIRLEMEE